MGSLFKKTPKEEPPEGVVYEEATEEMIAVNMMLAGAVQGRASEIKVVPGPETLEVTTILPGESTTKSFPMSMHSGILERLKEMAGLTAGSQGGDIFINVDGQELRLILGLTQGQYGEGAQLLIKR